MYKTFQLFLLLTIMLLASCSQVKFYSSNDIPITFDKEESDTLDFKVNFDIEHFVWGLYPNVYEINLSHLLAKKGVHKAFNLEIAEVSSWKTFIWPIVTLGVYIPREYVLLGKSKL